MHRWSKHKVCLSLPQGQALLSLEALEGKCEVLSCVDLVDEKGRKPSGGKMEAVLRLREPLSGGAWEWEERWRDGGRGGCGCFMGLLPWNIIIQIA